jgi:hypothetical protein
MYPFIENTLYANSVSSSVNGSITLAILLLYGDFKYIDGFTILFPSFILFSLMLASPMSFPVPNGFT